MGSMRTRETMLDDTIFAMATSPGRSAVAVCRISGPRTHAALERLAGRVPPARRAQRARFRHPTTGAPIDDGLALWFPAPRSYTGEDCAELHIHGGVAVARAVIEALGSVSLRPAEAGEFTRRAFLNGKLDLAQAEGVADLIDAETDFQRRQALRQLEGHLSEAAANWRAALLGASARIEAELDFSDEGDVTTLAAADVRAQARRIAGEIHTMLAGAITGERTREGVRVVIAGAPNAGKSTLLNALARREVAIVSVHPGTTRDAIEVRLDLAGFPLSLTDTAGMRESADAVEQIGIARAKARAEQADLVLWLVEPGSVGFAPAAMTVRGNVWTLATKCDLGGALHGDVKLAVSAATGEGLRELEQALQCFAREALEPGGEVAAVTCERHRRALAEAAAALDRIETQPSLPTDLVAEELRIAQNAIGRIAGRVDTEEVLGEIFGRFCIGK